MAKGARASSRKANNAMLKSRVFGPIETARTERLSSKLLELASQPKPENIKAMEVDTDNTVEMKRNSTQISQTEVMEVDGASSKTVTSSKIRSKGRVGKRVQSRKASIVFNLYKKNKRSVRAKVDFVYGQKSGFHFTQSLITSGSAIPFTAYSSPPTITMPRIKAITTGSVPSFLDVILNFSESQDSSSLTAQDTWLAQMKAKRSGKLIMYGDDTWLKLFPETFDRTDGTSSFFVSDFTEVDNNVTRHITKELSNQDWNTMILHYLGLDHIGHKSGPRSPYMIPKQKEMDSIVRQIYEALSTQEHLQSTLLVVLGDHGMNDVGNHGGSTPGETSPALVFISPKLKTVNKEVKASGSDRDDFRYHSYIDQADIAPTLAGLFGFPVPMNNLGVFIPQFLSFWNDASDRTKILMQNAKQILTVVSEVYPSFEDEGPAENCHMFDNGVDELACQWRSISQSLPSIGEEKYIVQMWESEIIKWLRQVQSLMSKTSSNYNIYRLSTGLFLAIISSCLSFTTANLVIKEIKISTPLLLVSFFYAVMMFSSSYVEEEQNFWHWTTIAWFGFLWIRRCVVAIDKWGTTDITAG
ncbi:GPI ethanolamine phosphate transferase 2 [Podosphaera aphanis]|nr:GPI ethanolamine phosphate transferase 2 [Podosphaera aphanis]